jgi:hypothetical protein
MVLRVKASEDYSFKGYLLSISLNMVYINYVLNIIWVMLYKFLGVRVLCLRVQII